jgi:hypothetical protein
MRNSEYMLSRNTANSPELVAVLSSMLALL